MQVIFGVIYHFIGGFASGSFYIPYKKVKGWSWESYWIVGGIFSWLIVLPLAAYLTIPGFTDIIVATKGSILGLTYFFGVLWGIGGLTYGLGVRYLGVSLGSSIILGLCSVFGALIPAVYYDFYPSPGKDSITDLMTSSWSQMVLLGILICVLGIIICDKAGVMKEKDLGNQKNADDSEFKIGLGIFVSIISGILSACFAFGIDAGKDMANVANSVWKLANPGNGEFLFQNNATYVVILLGGLTTNFIWCMILNARNRTFGDYTNSKTPLIRNYALCALAGTTWFLQFFFYGWEGSMRMGKPVKTWTAFVFLCLNRSMKC